MANAQPGRLYTNRIKAATDAPMMHTSTHELLPYFNGNFVTPVF
jgi:hypothetical protein